MSKEQGNLYSDLGAEKKRRAKEQVVDKSIVDNSFELMRTRRWILDHSQPVIFSAERRANITAMLKSVRARITGRP